MSDELLLSSNSINLNLNLINYSACINYIAGAGVYVDRDALCARSRRVLWAQTGQEMCLNRMGGFDSCTCKNRDYWGFQKGLYRGIYTNIPLDTFPNSPVISIIASTRVKTSHSIQTHFPSRLSPQHPAGSIT